MWNKETNRPDDWVNPHDTPAASREFNTLANIYEAGADAIVESAKAEGRRELIEELKKRATFLEWEWGNSKGVWEIRFDDEDWQQLLKELGE